MTLSNAGDDEEKLELSCIADVNAKWHGHSGKDSVNFFKNKNKTHTHHTTQQFHSQALFPEKRKHVYKKTGSTQMFIAVLFVIIPNCKQPKCPWRAGRLKRSSTPAVEYSPAITIDEQLIHNDLDASQRIMLSKRKPLSKDCMTPLVEYSPNDKTAGVKDRPVASGEEEQWEEG